MVSFCFLKTFIVENITRGAPVCRCGHSVPGNGAGSWASSLPLSSPWNPVCAGARPSALGLSTSSLPDFSSPPAAPPPWSLSFKMPLVSGVRNFPPRPWASRPSPLGGGETGGASAYTLSWAAVWRRQICTSEQACCCPCVWAAVTCSNKYPSFPSDFPLSPGHVEGLAAAPPSSCV